MTTSADQKPIVTGERIVVLGLAIATFVLSFWTYQLASENSEFRAAASRLSANLLGDDLILTPVGGDLLVPESIQLVPFFVHAGSLGRQGIVLELSGQAGNKEPRDNPQRIRFVDIRGAICSINGGVNDCSDLESIEVHFNILGVKDKDYIDIQRRIS